ncbi:hypothetical protein CGLO_17836 [Colletotrichum gloeosporioides Cg-14]|uniref:Uncharacterized protein n=1 Tax=Colletotrichum gloeosporioides (strain Cg-14) TaxID=1237896 RepID=T0JVW5_COLGC|nr:hypothetical protein CGLO_17836 [Colletotrichum gloeosporioides Cg-14]
MPTSEFLTTQTMGGYLVVLALAGGLTYYYMAEKNGKQIAPKGVKPYVEPRKENNAKKARKAAFASQKPAEDKASSTAVANDSSAWLSNDPDEKVDNNDFAKRMAAAKEGKKFDGKSSGNKEKKQKSVKQSRAVEKPVAVAEPEPAQAPAVEAVEESPAASPEVAPVDASGVSDMLEPAAGGPSVLRLTGTEEKATKPKNQKVPEKAETKKQRQNRQKAEAKKAAREEEEKERKVKLEKQLRTARIASGTPAKDGSQFMAAANGKNSWTAGSPNGASTNGSSAAVQPLDTFDAPAQNGTSAAAAPAPASDNWISSLPSEEEQMEQLKQEDEWNTVSKKSKKAKKEVQAAEPEVEAPAAAPAPAQSRPIAQAVQKPAASNGKAAKPAPSYGSFSALSTQEEEWDV